MSSRVMPSLPKSDVTSFHEFNSDLPFPNSKHSIPAVAHGLPRTGRQLVHSVINNTTLLHCGFASFSSEEASPEENTSTYI
ncbi:hypothetical protein ABKN59_011154 [Abortiporus biennis]